MKKTKIIIPALGLLLLSTAASVTGTVAWFAANATVTASGMQLKAKAEQGILISNQTAVDSTKWGATASAVNSGAGVAVFPTSTANAASWFHNKGTSVTNGAAASSTYETLTLTEGADGVGKNANNDAFYLHNTFYVKASSDTAFSDKLYVDDVVGENNTNSVELDKALRVLVKQGSAIAIFAPFNDGSDVAADLAYKVGGATTTTTAIDATATPDNYKLLDSLNYPAITSTSPVAIDVYIYFEGEDSHCKSENITTTLDSLSISIVFGTTTM